MAINNVDKKKLFNVIIKKIGYHLNELIIDKNFDLVSFDKILKNCLNNGNLKILIIHNFYLINDNTIKSLLNFDNLVTLKLSWLDYNHDFDLLKLVKANKNLESLHIENSKLFGKFLLNVSNLNKLFLINCWLIKFNYLFNDDNTILNVNFIKINKFSLILLRNYLKKSSDNFNKVKNFSKLFNILNVELPENLLIINGKIDYVSIEFVKSSFEITNFYDLFLKFNEFDDANIDLIIDNIILLS